MQLVAYQNGERIDATTMEHEPWRGLSASPGYKDLTFLECGLRAKRVTWKRQFFAHWPGTLCDVDHKSESPQHLVMKEALAARINATPGWRAQVEYSDPGRTWTADVMGFDTHGRRLAFEVQLSSRNEDDYIYRSQRYFEAGIRVIWVVPRAPDWRMVRLPVVVSGFGKTSDLPHELMELMSRREFQPLFVATMDVGTAIGRILHPSFRWPYGSPENQKQLHLSKIKAAQAEDERIRAEAEHEAAEHARMKAEKARLLALQRTEFLQSAVPAAAVAAAPMETAGMNLWASVVRCPNAAHPVLIWHVGDPAVPASDPECWRPVAENFINVQHKVDDWLTTTKAPVRKAKLVPVKGPRKTLAFSCPTCNDIISGLLIAVLPPEKWSLIAGPEERAQQQPSSEQPPPQQCVRLPVHREGHTRTPITFPVTVSHDPAPAIIGSDGKPLWVSEAQNDQEIAERQAAKDRRAAQIQAIRDNPRYLSFPNGFRLQCTDCGGIFEVDGEILHAGARCLPRPKR